MDPQILKKLEEQDVKLDAIYKAASQTRSYIRWTLIITVVLFVLPFIGLFFAIPAFLSTYSEMSALGI